MAKTTENIHFLFVPSLDIPVSFHTSETASSTGHTSNVNFLLHKSKISLLQSKNDLFKHTLQSHHSLVLFQWSHLKLWWSSWTLSCISTASWVNWSQCLSSRFLVTNLTPHVNISTDMFFREQRFLLFQASKIMIHSPASNDIVHTQPTKPKSKNDSKK